MKTCKRCGATIVTQGSHDLCCTLCVRLTDSQVKLIKREVGEMKTYYYVIVQRIGANCGHRHRTLSAAEDCAKKCFKNMGPTIKSITK